MSKENTELKNMMMEQNNKMMEMAKDSKCITNNTTNNNNTFNLQIYLNDTCKDAVNLVDFVDSLQANDSSSLLHAELKIKFSTPKSSIILINLSLSHISLYDLFP